MVNIKHFNNFKINESIQDDIKDAVAMVFADLSDKYIMNEYYREYDDTRSIADVSFTTNPNPNGDLYYVDWGFNTAEFTERIEQLKEYLGPSYKLLYSYKSRATNQRYIKTYPKDKDVTWLSISIYNN